MPRTCCGFAVAVVQYLAVIEALSDLLQTLQQVQSMTTPSQGKWGLSACPLSAASIPSLRSRAVASHAELHHVLCAGDRDLRRALLRAGAHPLCCSMGTSPHKASGLPVEAPEDRIPLPTTASTPTLQPTFSEWPLDRGVLSLLKFRAGPDPSESTRSTSLAFAAVP